MPTISKEDYLKTIYIFFREYDGKVPMTKIAETLKVSKAAISDMAKKLSKEGYLEHSKYQGINLTEAGEKVALNVLRKHRLWEKFLMDVLDFSWAEVHEIAENFEHHTSEILINKIDDYLGHPEFDPHGAPIPNSRGELPVSPKSFQLGKCKVGEKYKIAQVNDGNKELINYLTQIGIELQAELEVTEKLNFDNSIVILVKGQKQTLSEIVSNNIFVTELN